MTEAGRSTEILLVDDHKLFREGICHILRSQPGLAIVGEPDNGKLAVAMTRQLRPDLVLMDISLPVMNGIEAARAILAEAPEVRVVVCSVHADRQYLLEVVKAGARGYLQKNCSAQELLRAISCVVSGGTYFGPATCEELLRECQSAEGVAQAEPPPLTYREREVLKLVTEGRNSKEIAFALDISVKTVEFHRLQVMKKLKLRSLPELTKYAVREGITPL